MFEQEMKIVKHCEKCMELHAINPNESDPRLRWAGKLVNTVDGELVNNPSEFDRRGFYRVFEGHGEFATSRAFENSEAFPSGTTKVFLDRSIGAEEDWNSRCL